MHWQVSPFDKFHSRVGLQNSTLLQPLPSKHTGQERNKAFTVTSLYRGALIHLRPREFIVYMSQNLSKT